MAIKHLVMSGGGVKGIMYLSCIKLLQKYKLLDNLETIVGTSVGGIIGTLYNIGYSGEILEKIFTEFNLGNKFGIDEDNILNYSDNCGLFNSNECLIKYFKKFFTHKNIDVDITFKQLYEMTNIKLVITGSNINNSRLEYFNYIDTPDMKVIKANEITSCIPFYFTPIYYNSNVYLDGGIFNNFPIDYIDEDELIYTIALCCEKNVHDKNMEMNFLDYIKKIYCIIKKKTKRYNCYMVNLNSNNINTVDFNIDKKYKTEIFEYASKFMLKFIADNMLDELIV